MRRYSGRDRRWTIRVGLFWIPDQQAECGGGRGPFAKGSWRSGLETARSLASPDGYEHRSGSEAVDVVPVAPADPTPVTKLEAPPAAPREQDPREMLDRVMQRYLERADQNR